MVWETHKVRKEVSHSRFASLYLPSRLPTNIEKMLRNGNALPSCTLHTAQCSTRLTPCLHTTTTHQNPRPTPHFHLPCMQEQAGGGFLCHFNPHLPRMKSEPGWFLHCFDTVHATTTSLACNSEPEVDFMVFRGCSHLLHLPRIQERAGGGFLSCFDKIHASSTSFVCNSEPGVDFVVFRGRSHLHLPRI